jgi:hypothetical protein
MWGETLSAFIRESEGYLRPGDDQLIRIAGSVEEAVGSIGVF